MKYCLIGLKIVMCCDASQPNGEVLSVEKNRLQQGLLPQVDKPITQRQERGRCTEE